MKNRMMIVAMFFVMLISMAVSPAMGENTKFWDVYNDV